MRLRRNISQNSLPGRFARDEAGAVLVEFALVLPLMILFFAIMIESARTFWSYQLVISSVRDASRYLARVAPSDVCPDSLSDVMLQSELDKVEAIARRDRDQDGNDDLPSTVTINSITLSNDCEDAPSGEPDYRNNPAPIGIVTANVTLDFPMGFIFDWFGDEIGSATTDVTDQSKIYGQ